MATTVSMSTAATRSTTVRPSTRRRTPNTIPKEIRTAAATSNASAKGLPQMFLERPGDGARRLFGIGRLHVEPVDEEAVPVDVDNQRSGRQRNRVRKRESADGRLELGFDSDDAGTDVDPGRIDIAHHVDGRSDKFDQKDASVANEMIETHGRKARVSPHAGFTREDVGENDGNQSTGGERFNGKRQIRRDPKDCEKHR